MCCWLSAWLVSSSVVVVGVAWPLALYAMCAICVMYVMYVLVHDLSDVVCRKIKLKYVSYVCLCKQRQLF